MKVFVAAQRDFVPASHENPLSTGVWKKTLAARGDFQQGQVQMINWAKIPAGRRFEPHYHEDMQEIFILVQGQAEMTVDSQVVLLGRGDAVLVEAREVHSMRNETSEDAEFIAMGVAAAGTGQTVVVQ
jgi:mannose-6-phosphate isomerase-like protein (cupin superfamily)